MKILKFPIIFITIFIILGIYLGNNLMVSYYFIFVLNILTLFILLVFHLIANRKISKYIFFFLWLIISSLSLGLLLQKRIDKRNLKNHYTHFIKKDSVNNLFLEVQNQLKSTKHYQRYVAKITKINNHKSFGKILLKQNLNKSKIKAGEKIHLLLDKNNFILPQKNLNPYGFDYKKYLKYKGIYHYILLDRTVWLKINNSQNISIFILAENIRSYIYKLLKRNGLKGQELALASALFLGERQFISKETFSYFQSAGTIHILAISGLHIGILLLFLNFIFGFIRKKFGNKIFLVLTVSILWFYALLTGFSPSVLRAVIMFSFLQVGLNLKRETNVYNTLFASAFLMIITNPSIIFKVGFQMSFLAVLSIISFYPILSKPFTNWKQPFRWFANLFVVSLSAQIVIFPLFLYYFHQFPVYSLLANLFVLPLLFVLLFYGFSVIILSFIGLQLSKLFIVFSLLLNLMLMINKTIANFDYSNISNISIDFFIVILIFIGEYFLFSLLKNKFKYKDVVIFLVWIIFFQVVIIVKNSNKIREHKLFFLHQFSQSVVAESKGKNLVFYQKKEKINPFLLKSFEQKYEKINFDNLPFIQNFNKKMILNIDSLGIWHFRILRPDIVVLHYSPKINFDRLIEYLHPKLIIADASNYPSYIVRWEKSSKKYNVRFIDIKKEGAVVFQ